MVPNKYWRWCIVSPLIAFASQHRNIAFLQRHSFLIENFSIENCIWTAIAREKRETSHNQIWFGRVDTFLIFCLEKNSKKYQKIHDGHDGQDRLQILEVPYKFISFKIFAL
jgi:hypothetical protein